MIDATIDIGQFDTGLQRDCFRVLSLQAISQKKTSDDGVLHIRRVVAFSEDSVSGRSHYFGAYDASSE